MRQIVSGVAGIAAGAAFWYVMIMRMVKQGMRGHYESHSFLLLHCLSLLAAFLIYRIVFWLLNREHRGTQGQLKREAISFLAATLLTFVVWGIMLAVVVALGKPGGHTRNWMWPMIFLGFVSFFAIFNVVYARLGRRQAGPSASP